MSFDGVFRISIGKWYLVSPTSTLQVELLATLHGIISAKDAVIIILKLSLTLRVRLTQLEMGLHLITHMLHWLIISTIIYIQIEICSLIDEFLKSCTISKKVANMMFVRYQLLKLLSNSMVHQRVIKKPHCYFHLNGHKALCSSFTERMKYKTPLTCPIQRSFY